MHLAFIAYWLLPIAMIIRLYESQREVLRAGLATALLLTSLTRLDYSMFFILLMNFATLLRITFFLSKAQAM